MLKVFHNCHPCSWKDSYTNISIFHYFQARSSMCLKKTKNLLKSSNSNKNNVTNSWCHPLAYHHSNTVVLHSHFQFDICHHCIHPDNHKYFHFLALHDMSRCFHSSHQNMQLSYHNFARQSLLNICKNNLLHRPMNNLLSEQTLKHKIWMMRKYDINQLSNMVVTITIIHARVVVASRMVFTC